NSVGWVVACAIGYSLAGSSSARADGELTMRGAYYKERSTRVSQPMMDLVFDVGDNGQMAAHVLVDAITSASAASGAAGEAFQEIRREFGAGYSHQVDLVKLGGRARFSVEPDYVSAFASLLSELAL